MASLADKVFVPPRRQKISEWAAETRKVNQPGAYVGDWENETVPYMVEPMDELASPHFKGLIFVGPAQSAKTDALVVNWVGYSATSDPQDQTVYSPTFTAARDFSMRRIDRLHRHTASVGKALMKSADSDNKFDKHYNNGMMLTLSYPSVTEMAGKPVGRVALTDYDRMPDDIGGDGNPYDLASKRTTTFGSYAMAMAESSPSREIIDHKRIVTGHEAPPTTGILALYNRSDRRRWHWPCPHCGTYFEGEWSHMRWDTEAESNMAAAQACYLECPSCDFHILPSHRYDINVRGRWVKEGQTVSRDGEVQGRGLHSNIAGFWLKGVAAGLTSWPTLVKTYLDAEDDHRRTGDETSLKKFFNTDIGVPYTPKSLESTGTRMPEDIESRVESWGKRCVPAPVRTLVGVVDVQQNMFVVQIFGIAPGRNRFDIYLVDRFNVQYSDRTDPSAPEGRESYLWVKPGAYLEDWDKLTEQVIQATYPLDDDSGRRMSVKTVLCDSGGKAGVTTNAYNFYRKIRRDGLLGRFHLVKGDATPRAPRARITYPDADKKSRAGAAGEIPVLLLNPTLNKDDLDQRLDITVAGEGMIHIPQWIIDEGMSWLFAEMTAEVREAGKGWKKVGRRNEAWDLFYYLIGACASPLLAVEKVNWDEPPAWADVWDKNPFVTAKGQKAYEQDSPSAFDWAALGQSLG